MGHCFCTVSPPCICKPSGKQNSGHVFLGGGISNSGWNPAYIRDSCKGRRPPGWPASIEAGFRPYFEMPHPRNKQNNDSLITGFADAWCFCTLSFLPASDPPNPAFDTDAAEDCPRSLQSRSRFFCLLACTLPDSADSAMRLPTWW